MNSRIGFGLVLAAFLLVVMAGCAPQPQVVWEDAARDVAIARAIAAGFPVPVGITWIKETVPAPPGRSIFRYTEGLLRDGSEAFSGAAEAGLQECFRCPACAAPIPPPLWVIEVSSPVVPRPDYDVTIFYFNETVWSGTVLFEDLAG